MLEIQFMHVNYLKFIRCNFLYQDLCSQYVVHFKHMDWLSAVIIFHGGYIFLRFKRMTGNC